MDNDPDPGRPLHSRPASSSASGPNMDGIAHQLALQVSEQLPGILDRLLQEGYDPTGLPWQLECSLTTATAGLQTTGSRFPIAAVDLGADLPPFSPRATSAGGSFSNNRHGTMGRVPQLQQAMQTTSIGSRSGSSTGTMTPVHQQDQVPTRPNKRRKTLTQQPMTIPSLSTTGSSTSSVDLTQQRDGEGGLVSPQRKKRTSDNPAHQPSTLEKYISGVWESLYAGPKIDITEVVEQWQAIESNGQPKLLTDVDHEVATRAETGVFSRMSILTRKISQTSRNCRSLEVIVQAHWVQCFDDRVNELATTSSRDKAKKTAIAEACINFQWTEKELRNKMGIWRGYHDIKTAGGWAALVFAGMGLYRFCKYRVSFTEETFSTLKALRHRFEVAADTLHPRWRVLLGIIGESTARRYNGHPHDWVVNGPDNEAIPLPETYHQWDRNFSYTHIDHSIIDAEAWDPYDPRTIGASNDSATLKCQNCNESQSDDPTQNGCKCYPNLYGTAKPLSVPLQIFRTRDGKNNGLLACCAFEEGWAVGEFVGLITSGLEGLDVMVGQTDRATYQIWQGKQGNHTRFVNHSCEPNAQFERFVWLGKQRIVLASKGIEAGGEVTVDYGDTYWANLDKICRCGTAGCRYKNRDPEARKLLTPPRSVE